MGKKILYIAGYSRSGSTILDILLSSHTNIFGTGELVYLFDDWLTGQRVCTCGEVYTNCAFWKNYKLPPHISMQEAIVVLRAVESRKSINMLAGNKIAADIAEKYTLIQNSLFNYIFETSGKDIVIDSSKSSRDMAGRFYALNKYTEFDVYVVHLLKDGLTIVESYVKKGRNWAIEGHVKNDRLMAARSSLGWRFANSIAQRFGSKMPGRYLQVKYEDLVDKPENNLQKIANLLDTDLSEIVSLVKNKTPLQPHHNVGGNRLRLQKNIVFEASKGEATVKKSIKLGLMHRLTFKLIAGGKNKKFGY